MRRHDYKKGNLVGHVELLILLATSLYILVPPFYNCFWIQIYICCLFVFFFFFLEIRASSIPLQNYFDLVKLLFSIGWALC